MDCYEEMVDLADLLGLEVIEKYFKSSVKGLCKGNKIGISKDIESIIEKRCVLAEEIAHSLYTVGDILDLRNFQALKQEYFARTKAYEFLVPIGSLVRAFLKHEHDPHEIAAELNVTDEVLRDALAHYARKYGEYRHGKYYVYFSPLIVCEHPHIKAI